MVEVVVEAMVEAMVVVVEAMAEASAAVDVPTCPEAVVEAGVEAVMVVVTVVTEPRNSKGQVTSLDTQIKMIIFTHFISRIDYSNHSVRYHRLYPY